MVGAAELCGRVAVFCEVAAAGVDCRLECVCQMDAVFHRQEMACVPVAPIRNEG